MPMIRSNCSDFTIPEPARGETLESGSADWTGNKYPAKGEHAGIRYRQEDSKWISDDARVALVADGMGGHGGGDTASLITKEIFQTRLPLLKANSSEEEARTWLKETIETAAQRIKQAQSESTYTDLEGTIHATTSNMGSTVVATVKHNNKMLIAWAGDSRAYQLRSGKLLQLTEDHSWDNEARKLGLSEKEIAEADQGHIISSALGSRLTIGQRTVDIQPGDRFLLASDGLETLQPNAIEAVLGSSGNADETAQNLIAAVKNAFARKSVHKPYQDNTTVVVLDAPKPLNRINSEDSRASKRPSLDFRPSTVLGGALPMAAGGVSAANQYFLEIRELNAAENIQ